MRDFTVVQLPRFKYRALRGPKSIRLLHFERASSSSFTVSCWISEDDITSISQPYAALSYVWGDSTSRIPILLNGGLTEVTINLYEALIQLQHTFPNITIWIDALCIDQANQYERNHQVAHMRSIYSKAYRTISWLGPQQDHIERLFRFIDIHSERCVQSQQILSQRARSVSPPRSVTPPKSKGRPRSSSGTRSPHPPVSLTQLPSGDTQRPRSSFDCGRQVCPFDLDLLRAVQCIEQQPYWKRVWIIQEVVVGNDVVLMCGQQTLEWSLFIDFLRLLSNDHFPVHAQYGMSRDFACSQRSFILRLSRWPQKMDLAHALDWSSASRATDVRDNVYALLGLVNAGEGLSLIPDYSAPACTVYCVALRAMIRDWHTLLASQPAFASDHIASYRRKISDELKKLRNNCLDGASSHLKESQDDPTAAGGAASNSKCDGRTCGSERAMWAIARMNKLVSAQKTDDDTRLKNLTRLASDLSPHLFWDRAGVFYLSSVANNETDAPKKKDEQKTAHGGKGQRIRVLKKKPNFIDAVISEVSVLFVSEPTHEMVSKRIIIPKRSKQSLQSENSECTICDRNSYMRARLISKRPLTYSGSR